MRLLDAGDSAVTLELGHTIEPELVACVSALEHAVMAARDRGDLPGVTETIPTFRSLTVRYDPLHTSRAQLDPALRALAGQPAPADAVAPRRWRLPAAYGGELGVDLADVAAACGLSTDEVVHLHTGTEFTAYLLGFMPGFAFMGQLPPQLQVPRRTEPRVRVPAGSVATANRLTVIYPWESPGGWHLLGRCPVPLFDAASTTPTLLAPGDRVRFEAVSPQRLAQLDAALRAGELSARSFREAAP
jgi:inhibitor of KinA